MSFLQKPLPQEYLLRLDYALASRRELNNDSRKLKNLSSVITGSSIPLELSTSMMREPVAQRALRAVKMVPFISEIVMIWCEGHKPKIFGS